MTHFIQVTWTNLRGHVTTNVAQYDEEEMQEVFAAHERVWLSEGKIVEREDKHGKREIVDLQAFFKANK